MMHIADGHDVIELNLNDAENTDEEKTSRDPELLRGVGPDW